MSRVFSSEMLRLYLSVQVTNDSLLFDLCVFVAALQRVMILKMYLALVMHFFSQQEKQDYFSSCLLCFENSIQLK